jgi:hypothetical protein
MASNQISIQGFKDVYKKAPEAAIGAGLASISGTFMAGAALHSEWAKFVCAGIAVTFAALSIAAFVLALRRVYLWKP